MDGPSLREYFDRLFEEHAEAHKSHQIAHDREHGFAQRAIDTAATLAKENKADANEWRAAMNDRERTFATKVEVRGYMDASTVTHEAMSNRVAKLEEDQIKRQERETIKQRNEAEERRTAENRARRDMWAIGVAVGVIVFLINLIIRLAGL